MKFLLLILIVIVPIYSICDSSFLHRIDHIEAKVNIDNYSLPTLAYLGSASPAYSSRLNAVYEVKLDSVTTVLIDLGLKGEAGNQFLELKCLDSENILTVIGKFIAELPDSTREIYSWDNGCTYSELPNTKIYKPSQYLKFISQTNKGCMDTPVTSLQIENENKTNINIGNLGWVTIIELNLNSNENPDYLIISYKICETKMDFYGLVL